jgi:nucleoside-diphosphate-sugar epimerase
MASGRTALVTGVPGWAGGALMRFLLGEADPDWPAEHERPRYDAVRCLIAPGAATDGLGDVDVIQGDLRDPAAVGALTEGTDGADLFHFAGLIHPRRVRELADVNDLGTRTLLAHAGAAGVRRVVALSSNSAVGVSRDPAALFDENTPCRPYLAYGRSKLAMERAVQDAPMESAILRPCWFYGPGQPDRQTQFFAMVRAGKAPLVGGGNARRSISYVDAIARAALLAAVVPQAAGETYWIADTRPYPMHEIVDTIEAVLAQDFGLEVNGGRMRLPGFASTIGFAADATLQRLGLYEQRLHVLGEMNKTIACSVAKARRELGWSPGPGLREGMRRSVQWCLENGHRL